MSKKKKGKGLQALLSDQLEASVEITGAEIKDDFCNYSYNVTAGAGIGDAITRKGKGIISDDLKNALARFNAHLAAIDDAFKGAKKKPTEFDELINHELAANYNVSGFKLKGGDDQRQISLSGQKQISCSGDMMKISTPYIPLELSSYAWSEELANAANEVISEVEQYRCGKCTPVQETEDPAQLTIGENENQNDNDDFENAKV